MTIDDAIFVLEDGEWWDFLDLPCDDLWHKKFHDSIGMAISALRAQQEAENNEPLTLEELSRMEGQPIWRKNLEFPDRPAQCKVIFHYAQHTEHIGWTDDKYDLFRNYGKTWLAYRRPPAEKG